MGKYYVVKIGKVPGIYNTWGECKIQVHRFPGAIHASFKLLQEAKYFFNNNQSSKLIDLPKILELPKLVGSSKLIELPKLVGSSKLIKKKYDLQVYTDGSHIKNGGFIGYGAYCEYQSKKYYLSGSIDQMILKKYNITAQVSNPTAEFLAFAEVVRILSNINYLRVIFYIDYIGIMNWMSGKWKTKKPYIREIKEITTKRIEKNNLLVDIEYIPAHSNNYGNDQADLMAKSQKNINTFSALVDILKNES